jgi:hypothetical protein
LVSATSSEAKNIHNTEPYRPRPSQDLLDFFPLLAKYVQWMDWSEKEKNKLLKAKLEAELEKDRAQEKVLSLTTELGSANEELTVLHKGNAAYRHVKEQQLNKKLRDADENLAMLVKREKELEAREAKSRRKHENISADRDLFDAIENLGSITEKAIREMRTLMAGKNRPQQAFDRWATKFAEPNIQLVNLNARIRSIRDDSQQQLTLRITDIEKRERVLSERIAEFEKDFQCRDTQRWEENRLRDINRGEQHKSRTGEHENLIWAIRSQKAALREEQQSWRGQQAGSLVDAELTAVQKIRLERLENMARPLPKAEHKEAQKKRV